MKLAEALILRADAQKLLESIDLWGNQKFKKVNPLTKDSWVDMSSRFN